MPFIRLKEIREIGSEEREARLRELRVELSKLRAMIRAGGAVENPSRIREIRRAIARIMTVQNEEKAKAEGRVRDVATDPTEHRSP